MKLWNNAFAIGTELHLFDDLYKYDWDFSNLEEAFESEGIFHKSDKNVYLLCASESMNIGLKVIIFPTIIAIVSRLPPSNQVAITSVQKAGEIIKPLKDFCLEWTPFFIDSSRSIERRKKKEQKLYILQCTKRLTTLKRKRGVDIKEFDYLLPYLEIPRTEDEEVIDSNLSLLFTHDEKQPPVVFDYDWEMDDYEDKANELIESESLPEEKKEEFIIFVKGQVKEAKLKIKKEKDEKKQMMDSLSEEQKENLKNLKIFKFYPLEREGCPDISQYRSRYINRYYGKADEVFPPIIEQKTTNIFQNT